MLSVTANLLEVKMRERSSTATYPACSRRTALARAAVGLAAMAVGSKSLGRAQAPPPAPPPVPAPASLDLSSLMTPPQAQGDRDSCAFFAVTDMIEAHVKRDTGVSTPLSQQFLIYVVKSAEPVPRAQFSSLNVVTAAAQEHGVPSAALWPYNPVSRFAPGQPCARFTRNPETSYSYEVDPAADADCFAQDRPPQAVFDDALARRNFGRFRFIRAPSSWSADATARTNLVIDQLNTSRAPVLITAHLPVDAEGWPDDGALFVPDRLRGRDIPQDAPQHFMAITGYDRARRLFFFKNHWGPNWGRSGYGSLSFEHLESPLVHHDIFILRSPARPG